VSRRAGLDGCGNSLPKPEFNPRTDQTVVTRYTDYDIRAQNFSLCLYTVFVSQLPHHGFPQDAIFQFLHLLLRRNQSPSYFACIFTCFAMWVTLPVFHNSRGIIATAETVHGVRVRIYFFCKVWRVVTTAPYHSAATATSHGSVRAETRESSRSASLLH
jgi:hypothetical protein